MEKQRNRIEAKLVNNKKDYFKWTTKPSYVVQKPFGDNYILIEKINTTLKLKKPTSVGMCILQLGRMSKQIWQKNKTFINRF